MDPPDRRKWIRFKPPPKLCDEDRAHLLETCDDDMVSSLLVNNAWLRDVQAARLDTERAITVCKRTRDCGIAWHARRLARAASIAVSVIHDEYRHDPEAALRELEKAATEFGASDGRILIGKAKVVYGKQQCGLAADLFRAGLNDGAIDGVDRVFAMRLLGVCSAKMGDWIGAKVTFAAAAEIARQPRHAGLSRMSVGLRMDSAFARWKQQDIGGALAAFAEVLRELDDIPIDRDLRNRYLHATVRHVIAWVWAWEANKRPVSDMVEPLPGMCSNQEPHEGFAKFEIRDIETVWSLLAQTDQRAGTGLGLAAIASKRVAGPKPIILQAVERGTALDVLRSGNELGRAARTLIALTEAVVADRTASGNEDVWQRAEIGSLSPDYWDDSGNRAHLVRVLIAAGLVVTATTAGPVPVDRWTEDLQAAGALRKDVARILVLMADKEQSPDETLMQRAAAALARVRDGELVVRDLFECHFCLLNAIHGGDAEYLGGDALAKLSMQWRAVAERQRFSLTDPNVNCPSIIERCDDSARRGVAKVAYILISVAPAVGARIMGETKVFMNQLARGERYASVGASSSSTD